VGRRVGLDVFITTQCNQKALDCIAPPCNYSFIMKSKKGNFMRKIVPFGLRIPEDLKEQLAEHAARNRRSLNSELLKRLEDSLKDGHPSTTPALSGGAA